MEFDAVRRELSGTNSSPTVLIESSCAEHGIGNTDFDAVLRSIDRRNALNRFLTAYATANPTAVRSLHEDGCAQNSPLPSTPNESLARLWTQIEVAAREMNAGRAQP
jgi:hypothetical protein